MQHINLNQRIQLRFDDHHLATGYERTDIKLICSYNNQKMSSDGYESEDLISVESDWDELEYEFQEMKNSLEMMIKGGTKAYPI